MKYLKFLFVSAIAILTCSACSDKNELPEPPVESADPDYLFMFYGIGGEDIDESIISNFYQALDAGVDDKVKMTFQLKMSYEYQGLHPSFNGTRRFTGEDNAAMKGNLKAFSETYPMLHYSKVDEFYAQLKNEKIGDVDYDMTCADSLTAFIKWSKDKYPTAKRTILVLAGHGHGWSLNEDGVKDLAGTRGILTDNNNNKDFLTLNSTVTAVKNAGNVDMIYDDACMMCMYENIYGYAECAKYCMASFELTQSAGGNYITFINLLKEAGNTDEGLEKAMHKFCDYCVGGEWWSKYEYSDLGFYNLTKLGNLTKVMKDIVDALVADDKNGKYISKAFLNCELVETKKREINGYFFPESTQEIMEKDGVNLAIAQEVLHWMGDVYQAKDDEKYADLKDQLDMAYLNWSDFAEYSFSFSDLLRNLDNSLTEAGVADNPYSTLRQDFLTALKDLAHIGCTKPEPITGIDPAYELCSPGIFISPLNQKLYGSEINTKNNMAVSFEKAKDFYQKTAFDQQVKWSRMLEKLDVIPSMLTNPIRREIK